MQNRYTNPTQVLVLQILTMVRDTLTCQRLGILGRGPKNGWTSLRFLSVVLAWLGLPLQKNFAGEKSASTPTYDTYSIYTLLQVHILQVCFCLYGSHGSTKQKGNYRSTVVIYGIQLYVRTHVQYTYQNSMLIINDHAAVLPTGTPQRWNKLRMLSLIEALLD